MMRTPAAKRITWIVTPALIVLAAMIVLERDRDVSTLSDRWAQAPSTFVEVDGIQVHVRDEGAGHPLVLLHGTGSSLHTWNAWTRALEDSVRVVRLDLPGFGLTGPRPDADYRIETYVRFLADFLDTLSLGQPDLGGNSLGGHIAWAFAGRHPERVRRLVLVDPTGADPNPPDALVFKLARNRVLGGVIPWLDPGPFLRRSLLEVYADDGMVTDSLVDQYRSLSLRAGNRRAFVDRARTVSDLDAFRLGDVHAPTLLLWGEEDPWTPISQAELFTSSMDRVHLIRYPDVGHVPMEEAASVTARDVRSFLLSPPGDQ